MAQESAEGLVELGNARAASGDYAAAAAFYERALAVDSKYLGAHVNYALALTALGRLREAWAEAEWRFDLDASMREFIRKPPIPRWRGEAMEDELIVLAEQGAADMFQYLRFLPLARERVGAVGLMCPPQLHRLVAESFPSVELLGWDKPVTWSDYVAFVPLLSLPHAMALDAERIPHEPYLKAKAGGKPEKVGIVWRSGAFGAEADCRLEDLRPLCDSGRALVSLQEQPTREEAALLRSWGAEERGSSFTDYADGAAALRSVQALVTVDGPFAHLAGALGTRVHLLLNEPADVRWMSGVEDTLWYPSMRLHRKRRDEPWSAPVRRSAERLRG